MKVCNRYLIRFTSALFLCAAMLLAGHVNAQQPPVKESYDRLFDQNDTPGNTGERSEKEITVAEGDTFQSLSLQEFSTIGLWRHIAEHNQLDINTALTPGQILKIPQITYRPREFAEVIYAHGDNQYIPADGSATRPLAREDQIFLDDQIRTGTNGFASVLFRTGAAINLKPSSHVRLVKLGCLESDPSCFIELESAAGELVIDVPESDETSQKNEFHIETPHASAAVRGTNFDIVADASGMLVGVTEGSVAVIAKADEIDLPVGFGIKAVESVPLGEPIALLPATRIRSLPPRLAANDLVSAVPIAEAVAYEWTLSEDLQAGQIVSSAQSDQPVLQLVTTTAGTYYVHVRGIDENGLKGFTRASRINVAGIDDSFPPITLEATRAGQDLNISVIDPPEGIAGYEIQLSDSGSFDEPVSVDVGSAGMVIFSEQRDSVFVRARGLLNPALITPFGPVLTTR